MIDVKRERTPHGAVFYRWLVSYVVVLLVPITVGIVIYFQANRLVTHESHRANDLVIAEVGRTIDGVLEDAERLSWQVSEAPRTITAANLTHPLLDVHYFTLYSLYREFGVYRFANRRISAFYVYLRNLDLVIAPDGVRSADIHFDLMHDVDGIDFESWHALLNQYHKRKFTVLPAVTARGRPANRVALIHSIPELVVDSAPATLVVLLDTDLFLAPIERNYLVSDGFGLILDADLDPILGTKSVVISDDMKALIRAGAQFGQTIDGIRYIMDTHASYARDWTYLTAVPESRVAERSAVLIRISLIGLIVCLVVGLLSAYYQTVLRYHPVRRLVTSLGGSADVRPADEWRFIEESVSAQRTMHDRELRSYTLAQLAHGSIELTADVAGRLETVGVPIDAVTYGLIAVVVEGADPESAADDERRSTAHAAVEAVFVDSLSQIRTIVPFDLDSMPAFIVSFPRAADREPGPEITVLDDGTLRGEFLDAARAALGTLRDRYGLIATVVAGSRTASLSDLPRLYREVRAAYEYRLVQGTGDVIVHKALESPKRSFYYPMDLEQSFMNSVRCGDAATAIASLDDIYAANFERNEISVEMAKCLVFDLVSTMIKTLASITDDRHGGFWDDVRPVKRLLACDTAESIRTVMRDIIGSVCDYVNSNKKSHNDALRDRVAAYLDDNYRDPALCTAGIAAALSMNPAYLTRFFKEQTGYGIAEYLTRCRVERAKALLAESDPSVRRVAEETGFSNANGLIRAFRRFEGTTPQQYRDLYADSRTTVGAP